MTTSPVLSVTDELLAELEEAAKAGASARPDWYRMDGHNWYLERQAQELICAANPATVLALIEEVRRLRRWKSSNMKVMGPVLDYAQGLQIAPLGTSCTKALIADHARLAAIEAAGIRIKP